MVIASFLLGAVDQANVTYRAVNSTYPRQNAWIFHAGDTWRLNSKLTVDYGLRWDYYSPSSEKYDRLSFFDPTGANPGAGGLPGRLAFAGDALRGGQLRRPVPRKRLVWRLRATRWRVYSLNEKTVLRGGWGIFYTQAFYPAGAAG